MKDCGVYRFSDLLDLGMTRRAIARQMREGKLRRIIRGWYATPSAKPEVVSAVSAGGQLGCLSACEHYGLWIPPGHNRQVHVVRSRTRKNRKSGSAHLHVVPRDSRGAIATLREALRHVLRFHDAETALIVLESAVEKRLITYDQGWELIRSLPKYRQKPLRFFTRGAQSGSETRVRLFFQNLKVPVKIQEWIRDVGRVDLLVGRSWVIECDSKAHHTLTNDYHRDCDRDIYCALGDMFTNRLSYQHIWFDWGVTKLHLQALMTKRLRK